MILSKLLNLSPFLYPQRERDKGGQRYASTSGVGMNLKDIINTYQRPAHGRHSTCWSPWIKTLGKITSSGLAVLNPGCTLKTCKKL